LAVVVSAMKDMGFFLSSRRDWTTLVGSLRRRGGGREGGREGREGGMVW